MRVLVTGAAGFIGSHVTRALLDDGADVAAVVRPGSDLARLTAAGAGKGAAVARFKLIRADLADAAAVRDAVTTFKPTCAIHLAWYAVHGKYWTSAENFACVAQTVHLAQTLCAAGCTRFVGAGTCAEYDWSCERHHEHDTPCRPATLYGAAKHAAFLMLDRFCAGLPMRFGWARYNFAYGAGESPERLVPMVIRRLRAGETVDLTAGTQVRDFLHVDDVAAATVAIAKSDVTGAINVGSGQGRSLREVAETIAAELAATGATGATGLGRLNFGALPPRPNDPAVILPDVTRLTAEVGWRPAISLQEGLRRTVQAMPERP